MSAVYDALYLYGIAMNKTITLKLDPYSGANIMDAAKCTVFMGASGKVIMDPHSEKVPMYKGGQVQRDRASVNYFMILGINTNISNSFNIQVLDVLGQAVWNTSDNKPTTDVPVCGFSNEFCEKSYTTW
uniref:Uncharacterized protein n=1 Tax=Romanomermis culicivorax TaxID=13658 RepID=A0A915HSU1_ROMCU